ncbi:50S ribosomal protein L23 [Candidatus Babeliales bacterium]|nr:50S ribosomal protein L23 [Candidatus Babeliales bacterium]
MELGIYDIIKSTVSTTKSILLKRKLGKITLEINKLANKAMVRESVEKIWDVKVRDVRIVNTSGKTRMVRRVKHKRPDTKKAIVTLKPGYKIDLPDQYETMGVNETEPTTKGGK